MKKIEQMLQMTQQGTPWALARFNDSPMMAHMSPKGTGWRGDQPYGPELQADMQWCLTQSELNLFIGLPCSICYPKLRAEAVLHVEVPDEQLTHAVVQTNRNLKRWKKDMPTALKDRRVVWVSGEDQNVSKLPFDVAYHIKVKTKDAYGNNYDDLINHVFDADDVVFLSCGGLATIMAVRLFLNQPYATFIDIGSTWDPETRGVSHRCHKGTLPPCMECS